MFRKDPVKERPCTGEYGDGVEYKFKDHAIDIYEIIEDVKNAEDKYIGSLYHVDEGDPCVLVHVVEVETPNSVFLSEE